MLNRVWIKIVCVRRLLVQFFWYKTKKSTQGISSCDNIKRAPLGNPSPDEDAPYKNSQNEEGKDGKEQVEQPHFEPPNIPGIRGIKRPPIRKNPNLNLEKPPTLSKPELICRENFSFRNWEIFLSVDEKNSIEEVHFEDGEKLKSLGQGEYKIPFLRGRLIVKYRDREPDYITLFEKDEPLIFKLRKNWQGDGVQVFRITSGHFIIIAPNTWERKNQAPIEPFDCMDSEFRGHYWDAQEPSENFDGFVECSIPSSAPIIKLDGKFVFDDSEKGNLFIEDVPTLDVPSDINYLRVGEEAKGEWAGYNFRPHEQSLLKVLEDREGWFFIRAYDATKKLDSISFRYLRDLRQIQIDGKEYTQDMVLTPTINGYPLTEVRFVDASGDTISPYLPDKSVCKVTPQGVLEIPARKEADHISCIISSPKGGGVEVTLDIPRIWWRIEFDNANFGKWRDKPIDMTRQKFQQYAKENVKICLSSQRFKSVLVGFDDDLVQRYRQSEINLDNFAYHNQIINRLESNAYLNIVWGKETLSIIRVLADPLEEPPSRLFISPALVKRTRCRCDRHEWRNGRGFSCSEIKEAGLNKEDEKRIPRDCRRRSLHRINVQKIRKAYDV